MYNLYNEYYTNKTHIKQTLGSYKFFFSMNLFKFISKTPHLKNFAAFEDTFKFCKFISNVVFSCIYFLVIRNLHNFLNTYPPNTPLIIATFSYTYIHKISTLFYNIVQSAVQRFYSQQDLNNYKL